MTSVTADAKMSVHTRPANPYRALMGLGGAMLTCFGAGFLWGPGGGCLALGIICFVSAIAGEFAEQITGARVEIE